MQDRRESARVALESITSETKETTVIAIRIFFREQGFGESLSCELSS